MLALVHPVAQVFQLQVHDLAGLVLRQALVVDDLVQTVQELGAELRLQQQVDLLAGVHAQLVGAFGAALLKVVQDDVAAEVRGQDDDSVLEVHRPALTVGDAAIVQNLQQDVEDIGVSFFHLIEQHDAVGFAADGLGQLAALFITDVSRRRADQAADAELLHILGHVDTHHVPLVVEQSLCQSFCQLGLAHTGGAEEQEAADGAVGVGDPGAAAQDGLTHLGHGLVLTDDSLVEHIVQMQQLLALALHQFLHRDTGPAGHDAGDLLVGHTVTQEAVLLLLVGQLFLRFQPVQVDEPTVEDTISILRGLKERYEVFHGVKINDSALIAAATLSDRYITDRFLPDKAIDLVDEACAMIKTEMDSMPSEMDDLAHRITQLQIEQVSLKKETDALSQSRLKDLEKELAELQDKFRSMKAKWENEKNAIGKVQSLREQIEQTNADIEKAQREYDLNKAAELKYGKLPQLQKQLEEEEKIAAAKKEDSLLRDRVTDEEIARIVARWTGIPVEKLVEGEREKLLHLDDVLHQRVIGQDEAVTKVSEAILRSRAGIANPNRPIGSFLFLGPTGVGKTELAKALAQALFDDERNMVRIDMTEYMEKFSVSRLIGAPPGYVGYEEGGQLTEAVRRKPYSVVLFDEVEKAHPDVFNILLQVLDDGRITDSQGRTVDFKNTVIILTSNLGSDIILNDLEQRRANGSNELSEEAKHQIDQLLKSKFRPEFLNRLDEIVYYKSLTKDEMRRIVDLQLQDLRKRMDEGKHLKLEVTTAAKDFIIDSAYDSVYGARPIKRFIQSRVETLIAKAIIQGSYTEGNTLTVDCENGALTLR